MRTYRNAIGTAALGVVATGAALAWSRRASARDRRQLIQRGAIRELESLWTTVGGCRVHARVSVRRAGPRSLPVVLVHGFGVSSSYHVPTAERLAAEFDVYAPDLPGHGRSDTPHEPLEVPRLADALVGWMDAAGLRRASLVGHSLGGQIVVDAAVRFPDLVDRLVLIGPTADPAGRTVAEHARRLLAAGPYERQSLNGILVADYARMGRRILPELRAMLRDRIEEKLPRLNLPVMLVRGEKDPIAPQRWLDEAARLSRAERVAVIPGWGHAVQYSAPEPLTAAVAPFLRGRSAR